MWSLCDSYWRHFLEADETLEASRRRAIYRGFRFLFLVAGIFLYWVDGYIACFMEFFTDDENGRNGQRVFAYLAPGFVGLLGFVLSYAARRFPNRFQCFMDVAWLKRSVQHVTMLMGCVVSIAFQFEETWHYVVFAISIVSLYLCTHAFPSPINIGLGTFLLGLMVTTPAALTNETPLQKWIVAGVAVAFATFLHWFFYWFTILEREMEDWERPLVDLV